MFTIQYRGWLTMRVVFLGRDVGVGCIAIPSGAVLRYQFNSNLRCQDLGSDISRPRFCFQCAVQEGRIAMTSLGLGEWITKVCG